MTKTELKKLVTEVMLESSDNPSYIVRADKFYSSRDPDAEKEVIYQVFKIVKIDDPESYVVDYDEELVGEYDSKEEADAVAARLNNKDSNLKENAEVQYVEFARDMYNISEDGGKTKNPVRKGKVSDKLEASTKSNNRYDGGVYLPPGLRENDEEFEKAYGTVTLNDVDYDYEAKVTLNISNHDEYHGQPEMNPEGVSEIEISDIDIISIEPEPATDSDGSKVSKLIDNDIREKYGSGM